MSKYLSENNDFKEFIKLTADKTGLANLIIFLCDSTFLKYIFKSQ